MRQWIQVIAATDIQDGAAYFLAKRPANVEMGIWLFFAENRRGKRMMSEKPGIAMQFNGDDKLRELLHERPELSAVAVPADADTRWRARK